MARELRLKAGKKEGRPQAAFPSKLSQAIGLARFGRQDLAEQLPGLALEALQLHSLDRVKVGRAGRDRDARQQARDPELLVAGGLLHQVLARQAIAALLQRLL